MQYMDLDGSWLKQKFATKIHFLDNLGNLNIDWVLNGIKLFIFIRWDDIMGMKKVFLSVRHTGSRMYV